MARRFALALALVLAPSSLVWLAAPALGDGPKWTEPKDGVVTEKQADAWLDGMTKESLIRAQSIKDVEAAGKRKASTDEILGIMKKSETDVAAAWKTTGLDDKAEGNWIATQLNAAWTALLAERVLTAQFVGPLKDADAAVASAQKAHDDVLAAQKSGRRPMTPDEKTAATEQAKAELKDAETARADATVALTDAKKQLADAEAALKAADADSREQAQANVQSARDVFNAFQDTALEAARKVDQARRKAQDPDVPQTKEDKDSLAAELADREKATSDDLAQANKRRDAARAGQAQMLAAIAKEGAKIPPKNLEIARARFDQHDTIVKRAMNPYYDPATDPDRKK